MNNAEFYGKRAEAQRPPEQDPPLTMRVEGRDKRHDPDARRAVKVHSPVVGGWLLVASAVDEADDFVGDWLTNDDVRDWHITCELNVAVAYHWRTQHPPDRQPIEQPAERGDMDVSAFRTMG
jgi:hypothetical protein